MHDREEHVHQRRSRDEPVDEPERGAEQPPALVDRQEDQVVPDREQEPEPEVREVAEHLRLGTVRRERRTEEEREVDAREAHFARGAEDRRQNERPDETAGECPPDAHGGPPSSASARTDAAPISARWGSACGTFPRNEPSSGSSSSA